MLGISFGGIVLTQRYLQGRVCLAIKEMAKASDLSKNDLPAQQKEDISIIDPNIIEDKHYPTHAPLTPAKIFLAITFALISTISAFTICISNTLPSRQIKLYLLSALISWATDFIILRFLFVLILAGYYKAQNRQEARFEQWAMPIEPEELPQPCKKSSEVDTSFCTVEFSSGFGKWQNRLGTGSQQGSSSIMPLESIVVDPNQSSVQLNHVKDLKNNLETIKDDIDGENVCTGRQGSGNKENVKLHKKLKDPMKQGVISESSSMPSCKRVNAHPYCSPLRENTKLNQYFIPESIFHTSPKKSKSQFVPESVPELKDYEKHMEATNEFSKRISPIDNKASSHGLSYSPENISHSNPVLNESLKENVITVIPSRELTREINVCGSENGQSNNGLKLPRKINKDRADLLTMIRPSKFNRHKRLLSKGSVLNVSDFDSSIGLDKSKLSHYVSVKPVEEKKADVKDCHEAPSVSSISIAVQDAKFNNSLIQQMDEEPAVKIRKLLEHPRNQGKNSESILDALPYLNDSLQLQRPAGSTCIDKGKPRERVQDMKKINELCVVYSQKGQRQTTPLESKANEDAETKKVLPPLRDPLDDRSGEKGREYKAEAELVNNKHLVKIDKRIGKCFDKVKQSFKRSKHRVTRHETNENVNAFGLVAKNETKRNCPGNTTTNIQECL
eukprot:TRINITY_DN11745_c0_g1_i12.p1 TRINITY_DN11745_c0_g1~~TRINITY_DN11745_c0_g1_i12.p1  ORF type:complete len:674 (+),score=116.54 TRINITY_DN11745_c0_g1_i12:121-2142(+)